MPARPEEQLDDPPGSGADAVRAPRSGEVLAAKYRVERIVGRGGMGIVVAARHLQLGQTVAVKLLSGHPSPPPDATARFLREAQAAAALSSDHVVRIYDVGTLDDGSPFMVMEYLRGEDLSAIIETQGPQPIAVAVEYVRQACDAIAEAHEHGIVHRDLKPSNLFVTIRSDGTPHVKVLDFGISKSLRADGDTSFGGNLTATRTVLGSPYYMAPEQVRDAKHVDERADVWALGVILYELLAGRPPFEGETLPAVCAAIAADTPRSLRAIGVECPEALDAVVMRCLEKEPEHRFPTIRDLASALNVYTLRDGRQSLSAISSNRTSRSMVRITPPSSAPTVAAESDRTMVSGRHSGSMPTRDTEPAQPGEATGRKARGSVVWALTGAGLALAVGLAFVATKRTAPEPNTLDAAEPTGKEPEATTKVSGTPRSFRLHIDSTPQGADVYEGDHLLGRTPLEVSIQRSTVSDGARSFVLRKDGYLDLTMVQADSTQDVLLSGALVPAPAAEAPAREPAPQPKPRPVRRPEPKAAPEPAPKPEPPDIRLHR